MRHAASRPPLHLVALLLLLSSQAACPSRPFRTIPAHWVDDNRRLAPVGPNFVFQDMYFTTPTDGWVVGNLYLLRISGGEPSVTFIERPSTFFNVVRVLKDGSVWAGGWVDEEAAVWRYDGQWQRVELPGGLSGQVIDMEFENPASGFALVLTKSAGDYGSVLLEYKAGAWRIAPLSLLRERRAGLWDLCLNGNNGWAVGSEPVEAGGSRPLALRYQDGKWHETPLPEIRGPYVSLRDVVCDPSAGTYTVGSVMRSPRTGFEGDLLLRYTDRWERIEVPVPVPDKGWAIEAIAPADEGLWVAMRGYSAVALYAFHNGSWTRLPYPSVEEGRTSFVIRRLQFFSGEAWAIANDYGGPGLARGLLFHYANGTWTNKNWNYSPWRDLWSTMFDRE